MSSAVRRYHQDRNHSRAGREGGLLQLLLELWCARQCARYLRRPNQNSNCPWSLQQSLTSQLLLNPILLSSHVRVSLRKGEAIRISTGCISGDFRSGCLIQIHGRSRYSKGRASATRLTEVNCSYVAVILQLLTQLDQRCALAAFVLGGFG